MIFICRALKVVLFIKNVTPRIFNKFIESWKKNYYSLMLHLDVFGTKDLFFFDSIAKDLQNFTGSKISEYYFASEIAKELNLTFNINDV